MSGGLYAEQNVNFEEGPPTGHGRTRSGRVVNVDIADRTQEKVRLSLTVSLN